MMNLEYIQKRFYEVEEKEHWDRIQVLLFSEDKENVVMGMNYLETLDEEVYYDGVCTFLKDDGNGNWRLKEGLRCENELVLKVEILRMTEENVGHKIKKGLENGCFDEMLLSICGEIEFGELSESQKKRLLSKVSEMVEVKREEGSFLVMKYQMTQALWESVTGKNPSKFKGASCPVERVSWFDCVIFANQLSEKKGLEKVYEMPKELTLGSSQDDDLASQVKVKESANGYRLPSEAEWEYAAKGRENYYYAGSDDLNEVGWYNENSGDETQGVGQKKSNDYGLYDMSGNVDEWCFDLYSNDSSGRVGKGGCWGSHPTLCTISSRYGILPSFRFYIYGVRFFRSVLLSS